MSRPLIAWASAALLAALAWQPAAAVEAVAGTQLVMHVGPGAHHPSIGDVPAESPVTVLGCAEAEGWCLVRFGGRHGWIEGESLNVVGLSRPPQPVAAVIAPAAPEVVPVPFAPEALLPPFITADDVIVGMGEQFGLAAIAPGAGAKPFDFKNRHHAGLGFKHDFKHGTQFRRHGHFRHPRLDKHAFHAGKAVHFDGRRFGKHFHISRGHFGKRFHVGRGHPGKGLHSGHARFGKDFHVSRGHFRRDFKVSRGHFGQRGHFVLHGKGLNRGGHFARGHSRHHFGTGRFGHFGKASFGGLRIKGGWRP